jgi:hypothetical protein
MHEDSKKRVERRRFQGIISPERKTCKLCGEEKARESFFNNIGNPDGLVKRKYTRVTSTKIRVGRL